MKEWIADNEPNLDWFIRPRRFPRAIRDDRDQRPERQPEKFHSETAAPWFSIRHKPIDNRV